MLKHILSWVDLPWEFKGHAIELLLSITSANSDNKLDEHTDFSSHMTSFFCILEVAFSIFPLVQIRTHHSCYDRLNEHYRLLLLLSYMHQMLNSGKVPLKHLKRYRSLS